MCLKLGTTKIYLLHAVVAHEIRVVLIMQVIKSICKQINISNIYNTSRRVGGGKTMHVQVGGVA